MFNRSVTANSSVESDNPYWMSFSDIMAGLLVIFVLALVQLMSQVQDEKEETRELREDIEEAVKELARVDAIRKQILNEIKDVLSARNIHVEVVENNTILRIPEDQLHFERGRYDIPEDQRQNVDLIGATLLNTLDRERRLRYIDTIFVEGHTDSWPLRREMGNWGLSSYRAISVWNYWTKEPATSSRLADLRNRNHKKVFSVSGYAATRRVQDTETTEDERQKNRRIDIRFTMFTPTTGYFANLIDRMADEGF